MRAQNSHNLEVKRILIVGARRPEDNLLLSPAFKLIRNKYARAEIDILAGYESADIFRNNPWFRRCFVWNPGKNPLELLGNLRASRYELGIDFKPGFILFCLRVKHRLVFFRKNIFAETLYTHESERVLKTIEPYFGRPDKISLEFPIMESSKEHARKILRENKIGGSDTLVVINPASPLPKNWSIENFAHVCNALIEEYDARILVIKTGGSSITADKFQNLLLKKDRTVVLDGKMGIAEHVALFANADLVISADPLTILLACSVGSAVIGLYGPINPYRFGPIGGKNIIEHSKMPCFPCRKFHRCRKNFECLDRIEPEQVLSDARLVLDEEKQLFLF